MENRTTTAYTILKPMMLILNLMSISLFKENFKGARLSWCCIIFPLTTLCKCLAIVLKVKFKLLICWRPTLYFYFFHKAKKFSMGDEGLVWHCQRWQFFTHRVPQQLQTSSLYNVAIILLTVDRGIFRRMKVHQLTCCPVFLFRLEVTAVVNWCYINKSELNSKFASVASFYSTCRYCKLPLSFIHLWHWDWDWKQLH